MEFKMCSIGGVKFGRMDDETTVVTPSKTPVRVIPPHPYYQGSVFFHIEVGTAMCNAFLACLHDCRLTSWFTVSAHTALGLSAPSFHLKQHLVVSDGELVDVLTFSLLPPPSPLPRHAPVDFCWLVAGLGVGFVPCPRAEGRACGSAGPQCHWCVPGGLEQLFHVSGLVPYRGAGA
jgi:hypothetical protein